MSTHTKEQPGLRKFKALAKLMDSQFRIPGTTIRFGFDALIGLVPGAGDFASFLISCYMISIAMNNGASGFVLARMMVNIIIDALVGAVPILGDIFDVVFKANQRNLKLIEEHYTEGKHHGSAWKVILPIVILLLGFLVGLGWLCYKFIVWVF
ncbi:MAG: DUF4112 domain-containing protein [Chitinophagaceae bacterium]